MKNVQTNENNKFIDVLLFPEKLSVLFNILLIVIITLITCVIAVFSGPKKDYTYIPEGEEILLYDYMVPEIRTISSYTYNDKKFEEKEQLYVYYYGKSSKQKYTKWAGSFELIDDKGNVTYKGDSTRGTNTTYTTSFYCLRSEKIVNKFKSIVGKVSYYKVVDNVVDTNETNIYLKEDFLSLSKDEINKENCNEIATFMPDGENKLFRTYSTSKEFTSKDHTDYKISWNLEFDNVKVTDDYHIDYQMFGVDDKGNVYDLVGYYNLNKCCTSTYSYNTTVPVNMNLKYIIAKCKVVINNEVKYIYYKQNFSDLEEK